ncbi:iron transporter [Desulfotomaculum copahuensis]|uniref:Iron transporter n=1 Tax=Desulfotomaculum copahuensis TaxID=1838280 RepID=A0A1B7LGT1_9FIRM|nr:iron transporter [Desulfotomaculum copahuensis]
MTRSRVVRNPVWRNILHFLMVFGPGLIVMEADNDAGAVSTYTQAGAQYGLHLLWVLLLLLPVTYFCQEMVARLGIATGKGHAAMIYQRFGKWWGHFSLFDLQLVNFFTLVTEFAAISLALQRMGVAPRISVPTAAIGLIILVTTGSYLRWERITVALCLLDLTWVIFAMLAHPGAGAVALNTFIPSIPEGGVTTDLVFLVIAIVGTTIAPWQLFFQQSCVADKKLRFKDLKFARLDVFIGACFTIIVAGGMMIVGNVMRIHHMNYEDPAQLAVMIAPILGNTVKNGILLLMVNAAVLGTTAISLSSAWAYSEVRGWENSLQMPFRSAPKFYLLYIAAVLLAAAIVLIPNAPLQTIIIGVQVLAGLMLPSAIIFLQLLLNDKELLGEEYVNKRWNNVINWIIIIILFILSITLAVQVILPSLFSSYTS